MPKPNYPRATNAAYQLLANRKTFSIRTDVFRIANSLPECRLLSYGDAVQKYGCDWQALINNSEDGFSVRLGRQTIILYNEKKPKRRIRFTIAHEIGHHVLSHDDGDNLSFEREANCFARNLLCPVPLIEYFHIYTVNSYVDAFDVSPQMARIAIKKLETDLYYLAVNLYGIIEERLEMYLQGFSTIESFNAYLLS